MADGALEPLLPSDGGAAVSLIDIEEFQELTKIYTRPVFDMIDNLERVYRNSKLLNGKVATLTLQLKTDLMESAVACRNYLAEVDFLVACFQDAKKSKDEILSELNENITDKLDSIVEVIHDHSHRVDEEFDKLEQIIDKILVVTANAVGLCRQLKEMGALNTTAKTGVAIAGTTLSTGVVAAITVIGVSISAAVGPLTFGVGTIVGLATTAAVAVGASSTGVLASVFTGIYAKRYKELAAIILSYEEQLLNLHSLAGKLKMRLSKLDSRLTTLGGAVDDIKDCTDVEHRINSAEIILPIVAKKTSNLPKAVKDAERIVDDFSKHI